MKYYLIDLLLIIATCISCKPSLHYSRYYNISNSNLIINNIDNFLSNCDSVLYSTCCKQLQKCNKPNFMEYIYSSKHLSIDSGFVLDFIYNCGDDACPIVYLRANNVKPFDCIQELEKKYFYQESDCKEINISKTIDSILQLSTDNKELKTKYSNFAGLNTSCTRLKLLNYCNFLNKIKDDCFSKLSCDGTVEGFYEIAVFKYLYDRFGLRWHSKVDQRYIIVSAFDAKQKIEHCKYMIGNETANILSKCLDSIKLNSSVIITKDTVKVKYFCFAPGKGIYSKIDVMQNKHPYKIYDSNESIIAKSAFVVMF
jgi:hypothetical protein